MQATAKPILKTAAPTKAPIDPLWVDENIAAADIKYQGRWLTEIVETNEKWTYWIIKNEKDYGVVMLAETFKAAKDSYAMIHEGAPLRSGKYRGWSVKAAWLKARKTDYQPTDLTTRIAWEHAAKVWSDAVKRNDPSAFLTAADEAGDRHETVRYIVAKAHHKAMGTWTEELDLAL